MTLPDPTDVIAPRGDDLPYETSDFLQEMTEGAYPDGVVLDYHGLKLYSRCQYENGVRVVRYAQEFTGPMLVVEDLSFCGASLWERRTADDVGTWLLPALQHAIAVKARSAGIPVTYVDPKYTTQQCHVCGELGSVSQDAVECTTEDCPVGTVSRDESAALSIAQRAAPAEKTELTHYADD